MGISVVEYPISFRSKRLHWPSIATLEQVGVRVGSSRNNGYVGFLSRPNFTIEALAALVKWLDTRLAGRHTVRGCFGWQVKEFATKREFFGPVVYFDNEADAILFKICHDASVFACDEENNMDALFTPTKEIYKS